ncbi:F-box/LRR-repeat protein 12-like [Papaver somniferum]|uniref:F-box/LRR-repeat protein 12-like n=1 Tax=Papaver somniferum TaxID=3469 RepID=UPI000E6F725F|nr:F-box/LRR-repeat protein 12-like [Papaver somniferum]
MSLSCNDDYNQGLGKHREREDGGGDDRPSKIRRTSSVITDLPGDCLNLIFKCLGTRDDYRKTVQDRNSFGLTCRQWLHIQNNNHKSLWYRSSHEYARSVRFDESFPIILSKLMTRFQHLKYLSLKKCPEMTDFVTLKSQFLESQVQYLCLDYCSHYLDTELSLMFSWFPHLTDVSLKSSHATDTSLEALAKCCLSLESVNLSFCGSITDSGISFLLQNCRKLRSLCVESCSSITGIGFVECPKTLIHLVAGGCKLTPEGITAIVSGGGLEELFLSTPYVLAEVGEGPINTEAIMTISKGCPLLKILNLSDCEEIELQGWEAISRNCKDLVLLNVYGCTKLCDSGLQALCNG